MFRKGAIYDKTLLIVEDNVEVASMVNALGISVSDDMDILDSKKELYKDTKNIKEIVLLEWIDSKEPVFVKSKQSSGYWHIVMGAEPTRVFIVMDQLIQFIKESGV